MKDQIDSKTDHCDHASAPVLRSAFEEAGSRVAHPASEIQQSNNPLIHAPTPLQLFTQPEVLRRIGPARLLKFLGPFATGGILPPPAEDANYFDSLAAALASHSQLPDDLREALFTLENAVAPENERLFDSAIQRSIPC